MAETCRNCGCEITLEEDRKYDGYCRDCFQDRYLIENELE